MATRDVFSAEELARLRGFPEITRAELIRYFTLTRSDEAFVRKFHGGANVLGASVQLASLPWLGFVPDEVTAAPPSAVERLAERLDIPTAEFAGYGQREQTRTEHLREVLGYAGWRVLDRPGWKEIDEFLFARAMEHEPAKLLFRQACEYLHSEQVIRPGVVSLLEHVASARERAKAETWTLRPRWSGRTRARGRCGGGSWTGCWCRTRSWGVLRCGGWRPGRRARARRR